MQNKKPTFSFLIADDDPDDQYLIQKVIRELGISYNITSVYNGLQLMDYLQRTGMYSNCEEPKPDCLLLDLKMPLLSGTEALQRIRKNSGLLNLPVFIISEATSDTEKQKLMGLGANGFYTKQAGHNSFLLMVNEIIASINPVKKNAKNAE
jgi:two-component system response regulator